MAIVLSSAVRGEGLDDLGRHLRPGATTVLLGPSGAGKSTLVNRLEGTERLATAAVRADGRGRHTTTRREIVQLPGGALILDTPGLREFALLEDDGSVAEVFDEIEAIAQECRFRDCRHDGEPGCAVTLAVETGRLDGARLAARRKLDGERAFEHRKVDLAARLEEKRRWREIHRAMRRQK